ncbi:hypothetical protein B0H19DRAFT_1249517 [Mycena capillaripes]|nr:hypothetical protein B0H19DRAFT_1249517 [Mycena capillaripes]
MSTPPPRKDNDKDDNRAEKRKKTPTEDGGGGFEEEEDGGYGGRRWWPAQQARRDERMMALLVASRVLPPNQAPVVPSRYVPPSRTPSEDHHPGDYEVPITEPRSSVPSEEIARRSEDRRILKKRAKDAEERKQRKQEKRKQKSAEDGSEDGSVDAQVTKFPGDQACDYCRKNRLVCRITVAPGAIAKRKGGPGPIRSACNACKKRKSQCVWPGVKKTAPKKSKPTTDKKKSAVVSSDPEVEEVVPVVVPRTRIDRAAERLSEVERRLTEVERENRELRRLVRELRNEVRRTTEGSSVLAQYLAGLLGAQSGEELEDSWMGDAMRESRRIAEDMDRRAGDQGGSGMTAEEKEEVEKKKKRAEVDALADTDGGSEKSDDADHPPKVKEEQVDEGESWGEDFRRARGRTPPEDAEVIVITDSEDEAAVKEIRGKRAAKGKGRATRWVQSPTNSEDEENADPEADMDMEDAEKVMSEPPIAFEEIPKLDD